MQATRTADALLVVMMLVAGSQPNPPKLQEKY